MRRLLWALPLGAAIGWLGAGRAVSRPDDFGVLKSAPARPPAAAAPAAMPSGIEPAGPASTAPPNPYPLTAEAGEWVICAVSYIGPDGATLSRQVCEELRKKHRLAAYILNRGDEERRKVEEEWKQRKAQYPPGTPLKRKTVRIPDQFAVLVGGFKDLAHATGYLPRFKTLEAPKLTLEGGRSPYEEVTYREPVQKKDTQELVTRRVRMHPFHNAMVVRNPLSQAAKSNRPKWDPFWKQLNEDEEYSLLKNPKAYTLVVKEYMGGRVVQSSQGKGKGSFLSALGLGGSRGEALEGAALQARELAKFLSNPRFGFKTYVLHTRYSSVVCIGGFASADDPELTRVRKQIQSLKLQDARGADPVGLLPEPMPVEVPRF